MRQLLGLRLAPAGQIFVTTRTLLLALSTLLSLSTLGCNAYNKSLLDESGGKPKPSVDGGMGHVDNDAGPVAGSGGSDVDGGGAGAGGSGGSDPGCKPNPDSGNDTCTQICTEVCNGKDDDCDGKIDEDATNKCSLKNAESVCADGKCVIVTCKGDYLDCDTKAATGCETAPDDVSNCGGCGKKCSVGLNSVVACVDHMCKRIGCKQGYGNCDTNNTDCETDETTLTNCAGCGLPCDPPAHASPSCDLGFCGPGECEGDYGDCNNTPGDGCEQELKTAVHCGKCNQSCDFTGSTDDCSTGVCVAVGCDPGFDDCDGNSANGCESLNSSKNCGECGKICNSTLAHVMKATCGPVSPKPDPICTIKCADGYADCDGDPQTGCETKLGTNGNCTACDDKCPFAHGSGVCESGACVLKATGCDVGYGDCTSAGGCETPTNTLSNCGGCGMICNKASCSSGTCSAADCSMAPHNADCGGAKCGNCDTNDTDCEAKLDTLTNCGACNNKCQFNAGVTAHATLSCAATGCKATCDQGFGDCNNDYRDGCETAINTNSNCDACGQTCAIANSNAKCTTFSGGHYVCEVASCVTDYGDCDTDGKSCESQLNTPSHCKTCGTVCNLPNAMEACTGAAGSESCTIGSCDQSYFRNCDNVASTGCEIDVRSNTANCGACGNNCATQANVGTAGCTNSVCTYTCASGFKDCNSMPGCETNTHTLTDCGNCGVACSKLNAMAECSTGVCNMVPSSCSAGFADCKNGGTDGCETPLKTTTNCTGCGVACSVVNGVGSCTTGACQQASCNAGWGDCDGNPLDCERNILTPAQGGQGPCLPDTGCVKKTNAGRDYYFCPTARTWDAARAQCQMQLLGDLVRVDDQAENDFVRTNVAGDSWIGGNDVAAEGKWFWAGTPPVQFWNGAGAGTAVGGRFNKWNAGEPNDSAGAEDCAQIIMASGVWNDLACSTAMGFVCEVQADQCPSDPAKTNPGQCGCGVADTDTDNDATADCNDVCPNDPNKVAMGQCGCGKADVDSDADGVLDCNDQCPGVPDTDLDGDGSKDCKDTCPYDKNHSSGTCGFGITPPNFNPGTINFAGAPSLTVNCNATVDTTSNAAVTICGTAITPVIQTQTGGPDLWILPLTTLTVNSGSTLKLIGTRPAVLAVPGDATINGTIDVGAIGATPGAGGNVSCSANNGLGANGSNATGSNDGGGGGGGGAFGAVGFGGGTGNSCSGNVGAGGGGAVQGVNTIVPLRGGCAGGFGGQGSSSTAGRNGGAGGGALQISAGKLTVGATAVLAANGGGGLKGSNDEDGGGGGGSGGSLLLDGFVLSVAGNAWITANGGGGASGNPTASNAGTPGTDGFKSNTARAPGGSGTKNSGNGGQGGALDGVATAGSAGACSGDAGGCVCPFWSVAIGAGGGGGGGGVGRVRVHSSTGCATATPVARISPAALIGCP